MLVTSPASLWLESGVLIPRRIGSGLTFQALRASVFLPDIGLKQLIIQRNEHLTLWLNM